MHQAHQVAFMFTTLTAQETINENQQNHGLFFFVPTHWMPLERAPTVLLMKRITATPSGLAIDTGVQTQ